MWGGACRIFDRCHLVDKRHGDAAPQPWSCGEAAVAAVAVPAAERSTVTARPGDGSESMEPKDTDNALRALNSKSYGQDSVGDCQRLTIHCTLVFHLWDCLWDLGLPGSEVPCLLFITAVGNIFPSPHFCSLK